MPEFKVFATGARLLLTLALAVSSTSSQPAPAPGALLAPAQLDQLVTRIALYPDPLLAQVLTASTYWDEIPDAAAWAREHANLNADNLAAAVTEDNLPLDPSVLALLPFRAVLDTMAQDLNWTQQLGTAVLNQQADVMDAVQRMRRNAQQYGHLQSSSYMRVYPSGEYIQLEPVDPNVIYLPFYDPAVVFTRPASGIALGAAIRFGPAVSIGLGFAPWGWATSRFVWPTHTLIIDRHPWTRRWDNRRTYVHPYSRHWTRPAGPPVERHGGRRR